MILFALHYGDLMIALLNKSYTDVRPDEIYNLGAQSHVVAMELLNTQPTDTLKILDLRAVRYLD